MPDVLSPATGQFPSDGKGTLSLVNSNTQEPTGSRDGPPTPTNGGAVQTPAAQPAPTNEPAVPPPQVQEVLASDIGVPAMLNQLKASIASAKEFAIFLKKRSAVEETHASSLKKLSRSSNDVMHLPEHKTGSFVRAYTEVMYVHERIAENGMQFALSLHQMHDDLIDLAAVAERNRKGWKANGLAPEQRVAELESALRKSKAKYDALADEYDRARTGDSTRHSGKMFSLKTKSGPQHEEELLRKVQAADQDYQGKVQHLQAERAELVSRTRPEAVRALRELIQEIDSGLALQMQKFASFNEKLLLSNGLTVSPIKGAGSQAGGSRSLRDAVLSVDNARDLNDYLASHHNRLPPNQGEIKYERNPVLNPQQPPVQQSQPAFTQQHSQMNPPGQFPPPGQGPQSPQQFGPGSRSSTFQQQGPQGQGFGPGPMSPPGMAAAQQQQGPAASHNRSFSQGNMFNQPGGGPGRQQQDPSFTSDQNRNSAAPASRFSLGNNQGPPQGPPQLGALPFQNGPQSPPLGQQQQGPPPNMQPGQGQQFQPQQQRQQGPNPLQQHPPSGPPQGPLGSGPGGPQGAGRGSPYQSRPSPPAAAQPTPSRPVFGLPLSKLYERDGLAVPMVVYQCIQAVDLFGLGLEGIYRQSGSVNHINKLKQMFDTDSSNPLLDFRNPENFYHDVNSVTGLLKQFLRDLPDPLLTMEQHSALIEAAKHSDDIVRRDSLHAIINSLPDPNYATLRALTIHLHRVMDNSHSNRMNCHNLAVIFGPTLMGTDPSTSINDAGWQIKAVDTILQNTYQIFDDD